MKEYDVFLENQPEGDVFLYLLSYFANLRIKNGILLDSDARISAQKHLRVYDGIAISQNFSGLFKHFFEHTNNEIGIETVPILTAIKKIRRIEPNIIEMSVSDSIFLFFKKYAGDVIVPVGLIESDVHTFKTCISKFDNSVNCEAIITDTFKHDFEHHNFESNIRSSVSNIFYRDPLLAGKIEFGLFADMRLVSIQYRFLYEFDEDNIDSLDDMILEDMDMLIIED